MSKGNLELKVGVFVFLCLAIMGVLMVQFSKGTNFFVPAYTIYLTAPDVGGLKNQASVMMSGVKVGTVSDTKLSEDGSSVTVTLNIYKTHVIRDSAVFSIETSGFLGDQYIAVTSQGTNGAILGTPGHLNATVEAPFDFQQAARSATRLVQNLDATGRRIDAMISDVRRLLMNEETLTNVASTVANLRKVSEDAHATVENVNDLVSSNRALAAQAITNLLVFSQGLDSLDVSAQDILSTNSLKISASLNNLEASSVALSNLLNQAQDGHGLVGTLLDDPATATNLANIAHNLAITSSNLNRVGLWRVLWGVKQPRGKEAAHAGEPKTD
jgi:phospholipid/cholesterol/gamma-HCH transport system substrate-binding protein